MPRSLYPFPPAGTINDNFVIPTSVLRYKLRIAYEPEAVAYEQAEEMEGFGRRIRITAGNVAQLWEIKGLLWPLQPVVLFCFGRWQLGEKNDFERMYTTGPFIKNSTACGGREV